MTDQFTGQTPCPHCGLILDNRQIRCPQCWKPNPNATKPPGEEKEADKAGENEGEEK